MTIYNALVPFGYTFKYRVMDAIEYGNVPQHRTRIFIVAFLDNDKCAVCTNSAANVKLTVSICGKLCTGIIAIAANVALVVGNTDDLSAGATAVKLEREGVILILKKASHKGGCSKASAESGSHGL